MSSQVHAPLTCLYVSAIRKACDLHPLTAGKYWPLLDNQFGVVRILDMRICTKSNSGIKVLCEPKLDSSIFLIATLDHIHIKNFAWLYVMGNVVQTGRQEEMAALL